MGMQHEADPGEPQDFGRRPGKIWMDGKLVPWAQANVHVLTHSLHYGGAVFEGIRCYGRKPFMLLAHLQRLRRSAALVGYEIPHSVSDLERAVEAAVDGADVTDGYVRAIAWIGSEVMGVPSRGGGVHVAVAVWPWNNVFQQEVKEQGLRLIFGPYRRPLTNVELAQAKVAGQYLVCTANRNHAVAAGFDDALMLDSEGFVLEATGANLFVVRRGRLVTPPPVGVLSGITRRVVMDLAQAAGIDVDELRLRPDEVLEADEAFLTGTAYEIRAIRSVGTTALSRGPVTKTLEQAFARLTRGGGDVT